MPKISEGRLFYYICLAIAFTLINVAGILNGVYVSGYRSGGGDMLKACQAGYPACIAPHSHSKPQHAPPKQEPPVLETLLEGFALEDSLARH